VLGRGERGLQASGAQRTGVGGGRLGGRGDRLYADGQERGGGRQRSGRDRLTGGFVSLVLLLLRPRVDGR
jgi:hypothetical protein